MERNRTRCHHTMMSSYLQETGSNPDFKFTDDTGGQWLTPEFSGPAMRLCVIAIEIYYWIYILL